MQKTELWNVSEIRFERKASGGKGRKSRSTKKHTQSGMLGTRWKANLKYPGFLEPEFLEEMLPEEFGYLAPQGKSNHVSSRHPRSDMPLMSSINQ